jgi:hypothetical protein
LNAIQLVDENNNPICHASLFEGNLRLENYWSGSGENLSLEIIYTVPSESFGALNSYLGYPVEIPILTILKNINHDRKGEISWNACQENLIPKVERFTWLS